MSEYFNESKDKPPIMEDGKFYNIEPEIVVNGKIYHRVQCEYRNPSNPNEYVLRGIPEGDDKMQSFILNFTNQGARIKINEDDETEPPTEKYYPPLRLIK